MEDLYNKDYETLNGMIEIMLKSDRKSFTYRFFKDSSEFQGLHTDVLKRLIIGLKNDKVVDGNKRFSPDSKEWEIRTTGVTEQFFKDGGYKPPRKEFDNTNKINIHLGDNYGNQSFSANARESRTIQKVKNPNSKTKTARPWLEIAAWIAAIIGTILTIITLIMNN